MKTAYARLPAILPKTKLRHMHTDVNNLAEYINEYWPSHEAPSPSRVVDLVTIRARLWKLGIHTPEISRGSQAAWLVFITNLRIWIALGDLRSARAYRPPAP